MKSEQSLPEVYCDLNARMTENCFSLERHGSIEDLARLGLTLEQAVGMRFAFNGGLDSNEQGQAANIMFNGVVTKDPRWGYLAVADQEGVYWRVLK